MESIIQYFSNMELNPRSLLLGSAVIILGFLVFCLLSRFIFGKKSNLTYAISSAIGIILMCALTVGLRNAGPQITALLTPMPFVQVSGDTLQLIDLAATEYTILFSELLSMVILAFLFNTIDRWMPKPKNVFGWLFFRCLTVVLAMVLHLVASALILHYLPGGLVTYAPVVLLAILVLMLLTGALKLLVGVLISTVNPLIGALYTFFFATVVGKAITRAVFTTGILALLTTALKYIGITAISIAAGVLVAYIPLILLLLILWYIINRLL